MTGGCKSGQRTKIKCHTEFEHCLQSFEHLFYWILRIYWASQVALMVMNPAANAGDERDMGSIPASGRSPGEWNSNPFWYSCLENSMQRTLVGYSQWSGKEMDMTN